MHYRINNIIVVIFLLSTVASKGMSELINLSLHSDLHHENNFHKPLIRDKIITSIEADIFILAGDIHNGLGSINYASAVAKKNNKPVLLVAGNHEYYGHDLKQMEAQLREEAAKRENVYFLEKDAIVLNNVRFLGCTLWSNFELYEQDDPGNRMFYMEKAQNLISDFHNITVNGSLIRGWQMVKLHQTCMVWLTSQLETQHSGPTVVITHFPPVPGCIEDKWKTTPPEFNELSPYFVNDLRAFINTWQPDFWLYGHTHSNINLKIGRTHIITNQQGYISHDDGAGYQTDFLIQVDTEKHLRSRFDKLK